MFVFFLQNGRVEDFHPIHDPAMKDFLYIGKIFNLCRMSKDGNSTGFVDDPGSLEGTHLDLTEISWFSCRDERIKNVLYGWKIPLFDENAGNMGTPKAMGACCFPLYFLKGKLISQGLDFFNDLHDPFHPSAAVPGKGLLENWDGRIKVEP